MENALRRFKRKVQTENIFGEVKRHSYYLKPGERRRVKQASRKSVPEKRFAKSGIKLQPLQDGGNRPRLSFRISGTLSP